ncbi:glycosyl hydrolase family 18 protein [Chitinophaga sedimenti]|uniref:glycosyl hydrolase family 18 protein n=1 Tax=Chitinophaga sedimenti TaxID=2033606 RepID=UPI0020063191|nr:glycosyl hydrolase family 18 protein [Chitinophaga sedimenti]MCK7555150.1 glycosyl hydrolase family 18 protein [Chitinophaga sedimenti]
MKKISLLLYIALAFLGTGCEKDEAKEQAEGRPFTPRIFNFASLFPEHPDSIRILNIGQTMSFTGLKFSPAGKASLSWKVNDKEVATGETYEFTPTQGGDYIISVNASWEGKTATRNRRVFVIPDTYERKPAGPVVMAYLNDTAGHKYVNWDVTTHLAYKVATITAAGAMDISKGELNRKAEEIVGRAHLKGIPVLLGISGALSADGWSVSSSNNFGAVLTDAAKRAALVQSIKAYVTAKRMDGVDIMMTDINTTAAIINANCAATALLLNELRAALGDNAILTVTVTTNLYHDRYGSLAAANWLNVHAFEDGLHVGPGKALGQPSGYDYFVTGANLWKAKFPANKLVIGIPAFGLRYNQLDAAGNNLSWTSYGYMPYSAILAAVPTAFDKEFAAISQGVYFNGVPLVTQKAAFLKQNGFLGAYIWAGDYDVKGNNSLTAAVFNSLK